MKSLNPAINLKPALYRVGGTCGIDSFGANRTPDTPRTQRTTVPQRMLAALAGGE
jgi:hypothetical protein